jgi:hypothetical protein
MNGARMVGNRLRFNVDRNYQKGNHKATVTIHQVTLLSPLHMRQTHSLTLTHSIQQSPSLKANRFSASQEILSILWNPKVHYQIHNSPPPVPTLSQVNPFHAPHTTFWSSILIISSYLRLCLQSGLLPSGFPIITLYEPLLHTCYMPRQSKSSWFDRQYHIWWGVQIIKLLSLHSCHTISEAFEWIFNWHYA